MIRKKLNTTSIFFIIGIVMFQGCATTSQDAMAVTQSKVKASTKVNTIQVVNFNLEGITHDDFMGVANEVASNFAALNGLISKVWLSDKSNNTYGGVYSWASQDACESYRNGELYAGALANNPNFVNLSDKGFAVLEGPSKITHMK